MNTKKGLFILIAFAVVCVLFCLSYLLFFDQKDSNQSQPGNVATFKKHLYTLPDGWKYRKNYKEDGIEKLSIYNLELKCSAVVKLIEHSASDENNDEIFRESSVLENMLKANSMNVRNGQKLLYGNTTLIVFEYYYGEMKSLLAYMPAYGDNIYIARVTSSFFTDGKEEYYFNYDVLSTVVDILESAKKA